MGVGAGLLYFITDAFRSMRENLATTVFTSVTLGFSLAIFTLFLIVFINLNGVLGNLGERTHIVAYMKGSAPEAGKLEKEVLRIPGVKGVRYVSKEEALEELKSGFKGGGAIFEGIGKNPLPASFEIMLKQSHREPERMLEVVERLEGFASIDEVQYSQEWARRFSAFLKFIELAALLLGLFLAAATIFIITNTIRLTVYARRDEIEVMRLVGASDAFIKAPFFIEGVVQGAGGGLIAFGILAFWYWILVHRIPAYLEFIIYIPLGLPALLAVLVGAGVCMGVVASLISMSRFLKV
jgi:cell division transport system permease protein